MSCLRQAQAPTLGVDKPALIKTRYRDLSLSKAKFNRFASHELTGLKIYFCNIMKQSALLFIINLFLFKLDIIGNKQISLKIEVKTVVM